MSSKEVQIEGTERRLSGDDVDGSLPASQTPITMITGPFRATRLWHSIVEHLKENVEVGRHRVKMRTYDQCFTGVHAVDVTLKHIANSDSFSCKAVNRQMAVKVCQLLQDQKLIESLKTGKEEAFEDSVNKLYRFTDDSIAEEDSEEGWPARCDHNASKLSIYSGQSLEGDSNEKRSDVLDELLSMSRASWKRHSTDCLKRKLTPVKMFSKRISLPEMSLDTGPVSISTQQEVWKETALRQLLCLVDIPVLDGLLNQDEATSYSNLAFHALDSSITSLKSEDRWLSLTLDCVECITQRPANLASLCDDPTPSDKLYLFEWLSSHYRSLAAPLWSDKFSELHLALLNLLMQGRTETTLRALQLSMLVLPPAVSQHIGRLLLFMQCASESQSLQLSTTEKNSEIVERVFTPALICSHVLAPHQASLLVCFMRTHAEDILQAPPDTEYEVASRLAGPALAPPETAFCHRVSEAEFVKQGVQETQSALVELANSMLDNHTVGLKEKKQWLKSFQKQYPDLYKKHFAKIL